MRFFADGPSIPDVLLECCDAGRVVFLCGAGVSQPSGMPSFVGLTQHVIDVFDPPSDSEVMDAFRPWLEGQSAANVPLDQIFNLLHQEYGHQLRLLNYQLMLMIHKLKSMLQINSCPFSKDTV